MLLTRTAVEDLAAVDQVPVVAAVALAAAPVVQEDHVVVVEDSHPETTDLVPDSITITTADRHHCVEEEEDQ